MAKFIVTDRLEEQEEINNALDELIVRIYKGQELLGEEFSRVLIDNLWNLYEESVNENQLDMWQNLTSLEDQGIIESEIGEGC